MGLLVHPRHGYWAAPHPEPGALWLPCPVPPRCIRRALGHRSPAPRTLSLGSTISPPEGSASGTSWPGSRALPGLGVCKPHPNPREQRDRGRILLPSRRRGALLPLAWTRLKARCVAPPVFTLGDLQFTVIKSFNTVIIFLARAVLAGSDGERSWLTAARWT